MEKLDLQSLETQIDDLIQACESLKQENRALRKQQSNILRIAPHIWTLKISRNEVVYDSAVYIGQAKVPTRIAVSEPPVV